MNVRLANLAYRGGAQLLERVPTRVALAIGSAGGQVSARLSSRVALVSANLARVTGPLLESERRALVRRAFASYGIYWADAVRLLTEVRSGRSRPFTIEGFEHIEEAHREGSGVILALPHLGCWEYGGRYLAERGLPLLTVAEVLEPPQLNEWFVSTRASMGIEVLPLQTSTTTRLIERLRVGGQVALLADRDVAHDGVPVTLFGAPTTLPGGPAVLALRSRAPLVTCAIYHLADGSHHTVVLPPIEVIREGRLRDDVSRVTQLVAGRLESLIRRAPEQWHAFQPIW